MMNLINAKKIEWKIKKLSERQVASEIKLRVQPIIKLIEKTYGTNCANSDNERLKYIFEKASALLR